MVQKIEITYKTILFTILFMVALWLIYEIGSIIILTYVALVIGFAVSPWVDRLQSYKVPRVLAIFIVYAVIIGVLSSFISFIIPSLVNQTSYLTDTIARQVRKLPFIQLDWSLVSSQLELVFRNAVGVLKIVMSAASNLFTLITLLVLTFYFIYEKQNLPRYAASLFADGRKEKLITIVNRLEAVLGHWLRGQLLLMLIVGLMSYIGLLILGIDYVLPLALLAGLLEFVPNLGPILASIPAIIAGFAVSPTIGIGAMVLYIIIQQVENYLIVPQVMRRATGIHPLVSLLCLLIGGKLYGIVGVLLAIPLFLTIRTVFTEIYWKEEK